MKKENKGWDYVWLKKNKKDEGHFLDSRLNIPFSFDIHSAFIQHSFRKYKIPLYLWCYAPFFISDFILSEL